MAELRVQLPGAVDGATSYVVDAGLVESGELADPDSVVALALPAAELERGVPAVIALALDADGSPVAWAATLDPAGADIALERWSDSFLDLPMQIGNPPSGASGFALSAAMFGDRVYEMRPRLEMAPPSDGQDKPVLGTSRFPPLDEVRLVFATGFDRAPDARGVWIVPDYVSERAEGNGVAVDLATVLLPIPEALEVQPGPDPHRPLMSWSAESADDRARTSLELRYASARGDERWFLEQVLLEETRFVFPELPAELADRAPDDPSSAQLEVSLLRDGGSNRSIYEPIIEPDEDGSGPSEPGTRPRRTSPPDPSVMVTRTRQSPGDSLDQRSGPRAPSSL